MSKKLKVCVVKEGSQSEQLGIKVGDLVLSYSGVTVSSNTELSNEILAAKNKGATSATIMVLREEEELSFEVSLEPLGFRCLEANASAAASIYETVNDCKSQYELARGISKVISFVGWALVIIGVIVALIGFFNGINSKYDGLSLIAILPALGTAVSGFLLILGAQVTLATVDNADHTREIMKILNRK